MSYTFEDFKREHPPEIVEKFKTEWDNYRQGREDIKNCSGGALYMFIAAAFPWAETKDDHNFWRAVAEGKHRVTDKPKFAPVKTSVPEMIENPVESWLDRLTMRLGLWLVGGRETPAMKNYREQADKKFSDANTKSFGKYMDLCSELNDCVIERDEARASSDKHYAKLKEAQNYLDECNGEYKKLAKKHALLKRQANALRDKLEPPVKRNAKGKKRVKTKRGNV